ncbi:MAG: sulfurtransferase [Betaproteobacteria bacterium HGW-Betaproteobacteria-11]|nr:MAG: sulfurtransferase [Betaproteobacteria bacterium HGW-Betaproteobacteria-11]
MQQISVIQLKQWLADAQRARPLLLDVREPWEFATCHIPGSVSLPMRALPARHPELSREAEIVVICHHGSRSLQSGLFLEQMGLDRVINLQGGVAAWAHEVDPSMPSY